MDTEPQFWVRVLLLENAQHCTLKINSPFTVLNPQTLTTQARFDRTAATINVSASAGRINLAGQTFNAKQLIIFPDRPHIFNINGSDYRGKLKLIINPDGNSFNAINIVPLEPYLAGVVGAEMPNYWEPAALKAQAIAARTYCLYIKKHFGTKRNWDVRKTAANQVYLGIKAESVQVWDAVNKTYGQVLVCRQPDGSENIFPAYFSSTCGGHTENSQHVFGGDYFEPLAGVDCPYCKYVAKPSFFFWPMVKFDKAEVTNKLIKKYPSLQKLKKITNIIPTKKSDYGQFSRLTSIKLVGSNGKSSFLRAEDLRLTIDPTGWKLKSTICQIVNMGKTWAFISGRGYGHGVGLCQCGAQAMAREGKSPSQILLHYYPGSRIVNVY